MRLFSDYIQPLTDWLQIHPHWALFITFLISLAESLAIIGSIVPGSVTMTTIGILAGSGIMRVDMTLITAILGAIAGDSASYMLGYTCRDNLIHLWPFRKYPQWLILGKDYFARHGGKSVIIGRFIGPLRSIIPLIAGMMHMPHFRFLSANIISAIGWSFLYIMPGVLIGAASTELSPEIATRLFLLILAILMGIWLLSLMIKWIYLRSQSMIHFATNQFWTYISKNKILSQLFLFIAPEEKKHHYATACFIFLWIISSLMIILFFFLSHHPKIISLNSPLHLFFQSLRAPSFDSFFILLNQATSFITIIALALFVILLIILSAHRRLLKYWLGLLILNGLIFLFYFKIKPLFNGHAHSNLAPIRLFISSNLFLTLSYYFPRSINSNYITRLCFYSLLSLLGLGLLYFGEITLLGLILIYLSALNISIIFVLFKREKIYPEKAILPLIFLFIIGISALMGIVNYKKDLASHNAAQPNYLLTETIWWNQHYPILPLYSTNRVGSIVSLMNIQYLGPIKKLQSLLKRTGWQKQTFLKTLVSHVEDLPPSYAIPSPRYLNRKPEIIMVYEPHDKAKKLILYLWRSNYLISSSFSPIWIGSIYSHENIKIEQPTEILFNPCTFFPSEYFLSTFQQHCIHLSTRQLAPILIKAAPHLLLIKG